MWKGWHRHRVGGRLAMEHQTSIVLSEWTCVVSHPLGSGPDVAVEELATVGGTLQLTMCVYLLELSWSESQLCSFQALLAQPQSVVLVLWNKKKKWIIRIIFSLLLSLSLSLSFFLSLFLSLSPHFSVHCGFGVMSFWPHPWESLSRPWWPGFGTRPGSHCGCAWSDPHEPKSGSPSLSTHQPISTLVCNQSIKLIATLVIHPQAHSQVINVWNGNGSRDEAIKIKFNIHCTCNIV